MECLSLTRTAESGVYFFRQHFDKSCMHQLLKPIPPLLLRDLDEKFDYEYSQKVIQAKKSIMMESIFGYERTKSKIIK